MIRQTLQSSVNYQLVRCFVDFTGASYGERFFDRPSADGFTTLPAGIFWWLINIRLGYLVFWQGNICSIKPYLSNWFACQFGYDQLYVGNPNLGLHFSGNLYEGERAWYFNVVGGKEARFNVPQKTLNSYTGLGFCAWYVIAYSVLGYNINNTCIKWIKAMSVSYTHLTLPTIYSV